MSSLLLVLGRLLAWHSSSRTSLTLQCVDFKEWSILNHMETEWNAILKDLFTPPVAYKVRGAINRLLQAFKDAREAKRVAAPLNGSVVQQIASDVNLIFHHMPAPEGQ